jgi:4-hydroxybenzoate polyprenyltransferase
MAASATYLINDLWDLDSDRAHPRKRLRPFASGHIGIGQGIGVAGALMIAASLIAITVGQRFALLLLVYVCLTSAYTWALKRFVVLDVLTLACLYMIRILAGAVAVGVAVSSWLLAFSGFIFFGLALVKRCAELVTLELAGETSTAGRNYNVSDLKVLWPIGVSASFCSVVVFGLFINSPDTELRYASPQLIWFVALGLTYWLTRLWVKTARGEMYDDPLVFAVRDWNSRITILTMILVSILAYAFKLD